MKTYLVKLIFDDSLFTNITVNPLCHDKRIHIRLKDFTNKHEVIQGLEDKLAFYISYKLGTLLAYEDKDLEDADDYIWTKYISKLHQDKEYCDVLIGLMIKYVDFVDVKIIKKYKKVADKNSFKKLFGIISSELINQVNKYLSMLKISWVDFILNDNINIEADYLDKDYYLLKKNNNIYTKYLNKSLKKVNRIAKGIEEIELWE